MNSTKIASSMENDLRKSETPAKIIRTLREQDQDLRFLVECGEDEDDMQHIVDVLYVIAEQLIDELKEQ